MAGPGQGRTIRLINVRIVRHGRIVEGPGTELWVQNGKIIDHYKRWWSSKDNSEYAADIVIDGQNAIVAPGFIDVQINGAYGVSFSEPSVSADDVHHVGRCLLRHGVTSFVPTVVSSIPDVYAAVLPKLRPYSGSPSAGATLLGVHLEGPFINTAQHGAHDPAILRNPTNGMASLMEVYGRDLSDIAIMTMAIELPGAIEAMAETRKAFPNIAFSIGHSVATIEDCRLAIEAGATCVTHLFNAMQNFHHRNPCIIGTLAPGEHRIPFYGLICDGVHTHASAVAMAYKTHPTGAILVTDAISAMGMAASTASSPTRLGTKPLEVSTSQVVIAGTNCLAGSVGTFDGGLRRFKKYTACTTVEAIDCATLHPAQLLGISNRKGVLDVGCDADFVLLDDDLNVLETYIAGELAWSSTQLPVVNGVCQRK
ncbi:N-acetylglucosamine-6-phosphate deacetylase [Plasmodiophora brassicae]|uniref:N-acetylglucosamine-6-phosphate deacetylase n=1 Tax=Plasmodiophora brassicae TaxID=37360 RepID=A0A3P3Y7W2_PLABS|nr:unnamed protein product [Plasmodiophora brassicae]